jgi:hypothetical protein
MQNLPHYVRNRARQLLRILRHKVMRLQRMCPVVAVAVAPRCWPSDYSAQTLELRGLIGPFSDQAPILAGAYPGIVFQSLKLLTWLKPMALVNLVLQGQVAYNLGTDPLSYRSFQGTFAVVAYRLVSDYSV